MLLIASTRSRGFLGANFLAAAVKFRKELMHLKSSHESASEGKTVNKGELKGLHTPRGADFRAELRWRAAAHEFSSGCSFRNSGAPGGLPLTYGVTKNFREHIVRFILSVEAAVEKRPFRKRLVEHST